MKSLTFLGLDNTGLTELPAAIGQLRNLRHLSLNGNKLRSFPVEALAKLPYLGLVSLRDNEFSCAEMKRIHKALEYKVQFGDAFYKCSE